MKTDYTELTIFRFVFKFVLPLGIPPEIEHKVETLTPIFLDFPDFLHAALFYEEMKKYQV